MRDYRLPAGEYLVGKTTNTVTTGSHREHLTPIGS
jgi:hypothetical protein